MMYSWHEMQFRDLLARRDRLPHALLLRGRQGIGKLAFAEALVASLLCEKPGEGGAACGRCSGCGWLERGNHPDLMRLEPEGLVQAAEGEQASERRASVQITVESVRAVVDFIHITSHQGGAKVVLVHPAESLNVHAANALLKSLEEPPPRTYFVLVAHRWHQLPPTITSRCECVALPAPAVDVAHAWLAEQGLKHPALALADAGDAPLLALKLDDEYWQQRKTFFSMLVRDRFDALAAAEQFRDLPPALVVGWLQKWSYDLASQSAAGQVRYNVDLADAAAALAKRIDRRLVVRFLRRMVRLQRIVQHPLNARLFYEQLFLTYAGLLRGTLLDMAA